jgi:hypothetical protein
MLLPFDGWHKSDERVHGDGWNRIDNQRSVAAFGQYIILKSYCLLQHSILSLRMSWLEKRPDRCNIRHYYNLCLQTGYFTATFIPVPGTRQKTKHIRQSGALEQWIAFELYKKAREHTVWQFTTTAHRPLVVDRGSASKQSDLAVAAGQSEPTTASLLLTHM